MTSCDPATGCFQVAKIKDETAAEMAKILDQVWFCRYLQSLRCTTDNRNEFLATEFQDYLGCTAYS
jgi:hypothetical protein